MDCSCAPIMRFLSLASHGATTERQIWNRIFLFNFVSVWGSIASPMHRFGRCFFSTFSTRLTLDPAGMHCPSRGDAFVSSFFLLSRSASGAPCVRGVHSSNKLCAAVYCPISTRISAFFFRRDCSFRCTTKFAFPLLGGATMFAKLRSKIAKIQKIGAKVCAHHFV